MTGEQLRFLEERYLPWSEQKCRVCGAALEFASSGDRHQGAEYACSSEAAKREFPGNSLHQKLDHWSASRWYDRNRADPLVVELVREYRALTREADRGEIPDAPPQDR